MPNSSRVRGHFQNCLCFSPYFDRLRSRSGFDGRVTRSRGRRESLQSSLLPLNASEIEHLKPLLETLRKDRGFPVRYGPEKFSCSLRSFQIKIRKYPAFQKMCLDFVKKHARDERPRRISSCFLSTYIANHVCSTRSNQVLMGAHRDDGEGDDISLVFGLSDPKEFSGGLLHVSNMASGNLWRKKRFSELHVHKSGAVTYDVYLGRCVVLQNAEHSVHRMHWGRRSVAIVTAKPLKV